MPLVQMLIRGKFGLFLQTQFDVTDHLNLQAGIRHERIDSEVQDSIPYSEAMVADAIPTYTPVALKWWYDQT